MPERRATNWGQQRRLEFIDFRLWWDRRLNRSDLTAHFGISVPQASLDLARYLELYPANATYDPREKAYFPTAEFRPRFSPESSDTYLDELLALASGSTSKDDTFIGWAPPADVVKPLRRRVPVTVLMAVLVAIRDTLALEIQYQSFARPDPTTRLVSPHAIAFDGYRWHLRAYCHMAKEFRDFVLARIFAAQPQEKSDIDPQDDDAWHAFVELKIAPHPALTESQRRAIELDYAMVNGVATVVVRRALLLYTLRQLDLGDEPSTSATRHIVLLNRDKLAPYLPAP